MICKLLIKPLNIDHEKDSRQLLYFCYQVPVIAMIIIIVIKIIINVVAIIRLLLLWLILLLLLLLLIIFITFGAERAYLIIIML